MFKANAFKKILPGLMIVVILSVGIFGAFGVETAHASKTGCTPTLFEGFNELVIDPITKKPKIVKVNKSGFDLERCINTIVATIGQLALSAAGMFVNLSAWSLNYSVNYTIVEMGDNVRKIGAVDAGWRIFRDLANIVLIFALLVIGIATILRIEGYGMKALLAKLIIVALLINFSLFFTQIIIDASNLLAIQFHEKDLGTKFVGALKLVTFSNTDQIIEPTATSLTAFNIFLVAALGSIMYLVATFVLFAEAFLLIGRFVVLVFLMILSPLAFVGMILPATAGYAKQWWNTLFHYVILAPIFLLLTSFAIRVVTSKEFLGTIGLKPGASGASVVAGDIDSLPIIFNFVIIIFFLLASIIISVKLGAVGSSTVMKWGGSARKWGQGVVGGAAFGGAGRFMRTTAGRGASKMADSEKLKKRAAEGGIGGVFARARLKGLRGVAGSSFDVRATKTGGALAKSASLGKAGGKGGYEAKLKAQVKDRVDFAKSLGTESYKEQARKRELTIDIKGVDGKGGKQKMLEDMLIAEKNTKDALDKAILPETKKTAQEKYEKAVEDRRTAQESLDVAKKLEKDFKPGIDRQQQYADTLEIEKTIGTAFRKVPRKGKMGAIAVRQAIKNAPNKKILDEITKQIKSNDDSSADKSKEKSEDESSEKT